MNLSDVYVFKKVAGTLSFTRAAREMGISRSAVSKQVTRLERSLGAMLFNRNTRKVNLTEAGRAFDSHTLNIDTTIEEAADLVRNSDLSPVGIVSVTMPSTLGAALMHPLVNELRKCWPELRLNMNLDDELRDLVAERFDLAIRISTRLPDSSLVAKRLATTRRILVASPQYLAEKGIPEQITDLKNYHCLGIASTSRISDAWSLEDRETREDFAVALSMSADSGLALLLAARLNSGIIFVPEICIAEDLANGQLQVIPNIASPSSYGVYAVYPHRNAATKVKIVAEFIESMLANLEALGKRQPGASCGELREAGAGIDPAVVPS